MSRTASAGRSAGRPYGRSALRSRCPPSPNPHQAFGRSHFLRKGVAQPVEDEVARPEHDKGESGHRYKTRFDGHRAGDEEHFLVGDRQVRERVERENPLDAFGRRPVGIDDRRAEEPERQQIGEQVSQVAKVHGQRRQEQRKGQLALEELIGQEGCCELVIKRDEQYGDKMDVKRFLPKVVGHGKPNVVNNIEDKGDSEDDLPF